MVENGLAQSYTWDHMGKQQPRRHQVLAARLQGEKMISFRQCLIQDSPKELTRLGSETRNSFASLSRFLLP